MKLRSIILYCIIIYFIIVSSLLSVGCAQIGIPTGGPRDTLAPILIKANPNYGSRNVNTNKITFDFDEYIDIQDLQQNLIISPLQNRNPSIIANPKTITLKFRDTLLPNTTYSINFGNAIKDINESNILKDFTYIFSTGNVLDSLSINGKVTLAETGNTDSTMIVMLYKNAVDSTVQKKKPNYVAKVNSDGSFTFKNLPAASFKIYALKDGDGGKTYNSLSEMFAFLDTEIDSKINETINLLAYVQDKATDNKSDAAATLKTISKPIIEKKLRVTTNIQGAKDLLEPLELSFNNALKFIDTSKITITDTFYKKISPLLFSTDSTSKKITISAKFTPETSLILVIDKAAIEDSAGNKLTKSDTIRFVTKRTEDYGKLVIRFNDIDLTKNPVIQFVVGETVKYAYPILSSEFRNNMFPPGEYGVRILYDKDKNGKWTAGNYLKKIQPEIVIGLPQKLTVRADWDNEREINL